MNYKIVILFILVFVGLPSFNQKANAQFAVTDVPHIAVNSAEWLKNISEWRKQLSEMLSAQELREGLQRIDQLKQLKSLVELADLLDDVACLSNEYSFYLNLGANYHCLKFLNFQRVNVNMSVATDLLFKVATVSSFFSMNSEARVSFIDQVKQSVETASKEMEEFNASVRSSVISKSLKGYSKKAYYNGSLGSYNRYNY